MSQALDLLVLEQEQSKGWEENIKATDDTLQVYTFPSTFSKGQKEMGSCHSCFGSPYFKENSVFSVPREYSLGVFM